MPAEMTGSSVTELNRTPAANPQLTAIQLAASQLTAIQLTLTAVEYLRCDSWITEHLYYLSAQGVISDLVPD